MLKYVLPHLEKYVKERSDADEKPVIFLKLFVSCIWLTIDWQVLIMEQILRAVPPNEPIEATAVRLLNLNFASIHTT